MKFICKKFAKYTCTTFFLIIFFSTKAVYSASFTFPSSLTTNTSDFVLLSETGTTPSISGFSTDVLITITATAGFVKITTLQALNKLMDSVVIQLITLALNLVIVR